MTQQRRFEAVIFDFGGVITTSPFEAFNRLEDERGLPRDAIRRINAANPDSNAWAQFERAEITATQFDALFAGEAAALGYVLQGAAVLGVLAGAVRPAMVGALDRLTAAGYRLGCITNNVPTAPAWRAAATAPTRWRRSSPGSNRSSKVPKRGCASPIRAFTR